mgnify:CR=1 FL=1
MSDLSKRVTIDFPNDLYRMIKTFTAFTDSSVKDFVLKSVNRELSRNNINIPNQETLNTFKKTDEGKELEEHSSFNDFLSAVNQGIKDKNI